MTRIIRPVGPRAKRLRAADEDGAAKGHVRHFEFASPNRLWRTRRKSALFPHCSRIATFFVSSLDAALRLLVLRHARKKIFVSTIPTRRTLSVTNVTSLDFIFFMSDIPLILFSPACGIGVQEERRHVVAARRANITAAEHASLLTHAQ